jgi:hypothetical protein
MVSLFLNSPDEPFIEGTVQLLYSNPSAILSDIEKVIVSAAILTFLILEYFAPALQPNASIR